MCPGTAGGAAVTSRSSRRAGSITATNTAVDLWIIMSVPLVCPLVPRNVSPVVHCEALTVPMHVIIAPPMSQCSHRMPAAYCPSTDSTTAVLMALGLPRAFMPAEAGEARRAVMRLRALARDELTGRRRRVRANIGRSCAYDPRGGGDRGQAPFPHRGGGAFERTAYNSCTLVCGTLAHIGFRKIGYFVYVKTFILNGRERIHLGRHAGNESSTVRIVDGTDARVERDRGSWMARW